MIQENGHIYRETGDRYDEIYFDYLRKSTDDISTTEPLITVTAEGGYCWGSVPVLDVIKYALREHPELVEQAKKEVAFENSLSVLNETSLNNEM